MELALKWKFRKIKIMFRILIVEDTLTIREEIHDILVMEGYIVFEAENGGIGF